LEDKEMHPEPLRQLKHYRKPRSTLQPPQGLIITNQYQWTSAVHKETEVKGNDNTKETPPAHPNQPKETATISE